MELDQFWEKVKKTKTCWLWTGSKFINGYGAIWLSGKQKYAHRVSWTIHNKKLRKGLDIMHSCDVRHCVRIDHLSQGNRKKNMQDASVKGRMRGYAFNNTLKSKCLMGHPYDEENTMHLVYHGRKRRACRTCKKVWAKRYKDPKWVKGSRYPSAVSTLK